MPQEHLFKQNAVPTAQPNPWVPADCGSLAKNAVFGAVKSYLEKAHRVENTDISNITDHPEVYTGFPAGKKKT